MLLWVWLAEKCKQPLGWAALAQVWSLPFLIWLRVGYDAESSKWTTWAILTLLLAKPMCMCLLFPYRIVPRHAFPLSTAVANREIVQPLQVNLVSRNSNGVRLRTVSAALYNMTVQVSQIIGANIYRDDDAPLYRRGNSVLLGIVAWNLLAYGIAKVYYLWKNKARDEKWRAMSGEEQLDYLEKNQDLGNKRLDFRFAS